MLINLQELYEYAVKLRSGHKTTIAIDFETTGFDPYKGARAFLIGVSTKELGEVSCWLVGDGREKSVLAELTGHRNHRYAAHNAKFEMHFLAHQYGIHITGQVWDTQVMARVQKNNHLKYSLEACSGRIGLEKYKPMTDWVKTFPAKTCKYEEAHHDLIIPYVEQDARLSRLLVEDQIKTFVEWDRSGRSSIQPVILLEMATTKNLFQMERQGLHLDVDYCERALAYEKKRIESAKDRFSIHGKLIDSAKNLAPIFNGAGIGYGRTNLGNPSFTSKILKENSDKEIPQIILESREAKKRASSYWENLLELHTNGKLHPSIRQSGAATSRMSIVDPAAQTWPDDSDDDREFPIRKSILAPHNSIFADLDYAQMEFRLMCDEAEDFRTIKAIKEGTDIHTEVAEMAKVPRSLAKNGRFAKLYGAGVPKIASTLGITEELARTISEAIDKNSPGIASYTRRLVRQAERSGQGTNWFGRRYFFDKGFSYLYPNYRCQGGSSEILRIAINECGSYIRDHRKGNSHMVLPVHDSILFSLDKSDIGMLPELKRIMINAHRSKRHLSMDVSVTVGVNYHDQNPWIS